MATRKKKPIKKSVIVRVYERIINEKKSTIIGSVLLAASFTLVIIGKIEWEVFVAFLPTCLGLMYVRDTEMMP